MGVEVFCFFGLGVFGAFGFSSATGAQGEVGSGIPNVFSISASQNTSSSVVEVGFEAELSEVTGAKFFSQSGRSSFAGVGATSGTSAGAGSSSDASAGSRSDT